ncbi:hypothetical protein EV138_4588 [Kribbella voronezhensis]|uniref:Uncharacterized protein n=1 Tax=Kribbella voronezhensis TaxID=2512212 RepID=A0A4R7THL9_9ACTN|nr:hypothetical protein [Kribbella voronezhensis]TDU90987.1 hypothetical protein EV138_4588 [Kribbella voronezhensis]
MAERFDLDAIEADDALLDLLAAGGETAWAAAEHDPALMLLAELRLAVEVEDELPVETIDDPESFLARCAALNPVTDPFARKMAARGLALGVAAVAALSVSGVAAAFTGNPLSPYEKVIEKVVQGLSPETTVPKEQLDGMPIFDKTKIVKVQKDYQKKQEEQQAAKDAEEKNDPSVAGPVLLKDLFKPQPLARPVPAQVEKPTTIKDPDPPQVVEPTQPSDPGDQPTSDPTDQPTGDPTDPPTEPTTPPPSEPTSDPTTPAPTDPPSSDPTQPADGGASDHGSTGAGSTDNPATTPVPTTIPGESTGENTTGDTTTGDTATGGTTTGDTTTGDTPAGDTTTGDTTVGDTATGDTGDGQTGAGTTESTESASQTDAATLGELLPTPSGRPTELPKRLEQYFGGSLASSAKHSSGKVSLGYAKGKYQPGKHSNGKYVEGRHAAIARAHGSMAPMTLRQILTVLNIPMTER